MKFTKTEEKWREETCRLYPDYKPCTRKNGEEFGKKYVCDVTIPTQKGEIVVALVAKIELMPGASVRRYCVEISNVSGKSVEGFKNALSDPNYWSTDPSCILSHAPELSKSTKYKYFLNVVEQCLKITAEGYPEPPEPTRGPIYGYFYAEELMAEAAVALKELEWENGFVVCHDKDKQNVRLYLRIAYVAAFHIDGRWEEIKSRLPKIIPLLKATVELRKEKSIDLLWVEKDVKDLPWKKTDDISPVV